MIKLTTKIYNDVIKTIDEDKKLNEEVKEYVKSLFVLQKKVNKITWKIAQDRMNEIKGRALMIHAGGDNHSDHPAPLGGGGARMACGVIK